MGKTVHPSIRQIKGEMNIAPSKPLAVLLQNASDQDREWLESNRHYLDFLARLESATVLESGEEAPESATALVGEMKVLIPMAGLIDKEAELARLEKEIGKITSDMERISKKLENPNFVDRAPAAVVQKEKNRLSDQQSALDNLQGQLEKIRKL